MWKLIKRLFKRNKKQEIKKPAPTLDEIVVKMIRIEPKSRIMPSKHAKQVIQRCLNLTSTPYRERPRITYSEWVQNARMVDELYRRRHAS